MKDTEIPGIPIKLVRMMKMTKAGSKAAVLVQEVITSEYEFNTEVRKGLGLAATMFNVALEGVVRLCKLKGMITEKSVQVIAYGDDVAVII